MAQRSEIADRRQVTVQTVSRPISIHIEPRTIWLAAAIALSLLLTWIVFIRGLQVLIFFFIAIIFAEGIRPVVTWMGSVMPRPIAVILIYLVLLVILAGTTFLLARPLAAQATQLINHLPHYITKLQHLVNQAEHELGAGLQFNHLMQRARSEVLHALRGLAPLLIHLPLTLLQLFLRILEVLFIAFFWLTAVHHLKGFVVGLLPPGAQNRGSKILTELSQKLGGYLRGVVVNMVIVGILTWAGLALLGVPYSVLLGALAGLAELIPLVGVYISGVPAVLLALVSGGLLKAGEVWLFLAVLQQFQGSVIQTIVMKQAVNLNPVITLLAVLLGAAVFGILGALIAVPLAIVLRVVVNQVLAPAVRRATGSASSGPGA